MAKITSNGLVPDSDWRYQEGSTILTGQLLNKRSKKKPADKTDDKEPTRETTATSKEGKPKS